MVLFHLTGDRAWLQSPFLPRRDVRLIAEPDAGLPDEIQQRVRAAAVAILSGPLEPVVDDPGDELMVEMMSVCLGEAVPPEYAPMMREDLGLCPRHVTWSGAPVAAPTEPYVMIVGAGVSGIALGAGLGRLGVPYTVVERNDEVGGTWLENRYPGCGVDTPNHSYSYSFGARYPWTMYFSARDQIEDYLVGCADEFGVRDHVRFGTEVTCARWDDGSQRWIVGLRTAAGDEEVRVPVLVSAIGQLSLPKLPGIAGLDTFDGPCFHTAAWPVGLDLTGRDVAIIGTGASAMQIVPTIVGEVGSLAVYQRTAQWARPIPHYHDPISDGAQWLLQHVPYYAAWFRLTMLWRYGDGLLPFLRKDPDWPHPERSLNRVNDRHRQEMTDHIVAELADRPDLVATCIPTYPPYGKRILLDNGWYRAISEPNVELVTEPVDRIEPGAVVTADGARRAADVVVLATGFEVGQMAARLHLTGRTGVTLAERWAGDDPRAHLGITVPEFPNLFCMQGPSTGLGHGGSAIFQAECQARYITACVVAMLEGGLASIEVREEVHDDYVRRVDAEHEQMIWTHPGMSTYYRNARGRVVSVMPWRLVDYWGMTHDPDLGEFVVRQPTART